MTIEIGAEIPPRSTIVEPGRMKVFSLLTDDPNPIHWDRDAVSALGLGDRLINQGGLNVAYVVNAVAEWAGGPERIAHVNVRFRGNVLEGDEVVATGTVTGIEGDIASIDVCLTGPNDVKVITGTIRVRVSE